MRNAHVIRQKLPERDHWCALLEHSSSGGDNSTPPILKASTHKALSLTNTLQHVSPVNAIGTVIAVICNWRKLFWSIDEHALHGRLYSLRLCQFLVGLGSLTPSSLVAAWHSRGQGAQNSH